MHRSVISNVTRGLQSVRLVPALRNSRFKQEHNVLCSEWHLLRTFGREPLTCMWSKAVPLGEAVVRGPLKLSGDNKQNS